MLKYLPLYLDVQRSGEWKRRFEATEHYGTASLAICVPHYPPVMQEELTGKTVLLVGYGAIGKEIERMARSIQRPAPARCAHATL